VYADVEAWSLSVTDIFGLAPGFWPPLVIFQSKKPQGGAATPAVFRHSHDQIRLNIRLDP
jgi:hypothetical protein